jgi:hypothetical protein
VAVHNQSDERQIDDGSCSMVRHLDLQLQRVRWAPRQNDHQFGLSLVFGIPFLHPQAPIARRDPERHADRCERRNR